MKLCDVALKVTLALTASDSLHFTISKYYVFLAHCRNTVYASGFVNRYLYR